MEDFDQYTKSGIAKQLLNCDGNVYTSLHSLCTVSVLGQDKGYTFK